MIEISEKNESKSLIKGTISSSDLTRTLAESEIRTRFSADEMISSSDLKRVSQSKIGKK